MNTTRQIQAVFLGMILFNASCSAQALEIAWFEQRNPGSAEGELRIANLGDGDLDIRTPGHDLEVGIARYGNRAVVTLSQRRSAMPEMPDGKHQHPKNLTVTARQGQESVRADFWIAMPAPAKQPDASSAKPAEAMINFKQPDKKALTVLSASAHAGAAATAAKPVAGNAPAAEPVDNSCPVLAVKPGSLKNNVNRLINLCGAYMGEWITPGEQPGFYTDWIVRDPVVLTDSNTRGLGGLLAQLEQRYGLKGVRHPRLPHTFDIYKIQKAEE